MAEVALDHIEKIYGNGVRAVRDFNLTIADGEFLVLVGPSGSGKTTILRLIAGLEQPTTGTIRMNNRVVNMLAPRFREVGMVFQRPALYPHLTVGDNLAFGLRMRCHTSWLTRAFSRFLFPAKREKLLHLKGEIPRRVESAAQMLDLEEVLDRLPHQLSGGQQQRVALGRALVRQASVFLLDEPLSNLDSQFRADLRRQLHLLHQRFRATMMYVTHDQTEAMALGERMLVLDGGVIQQLDRPTRVYEQPRNRFVAGFIGSPPMNFVNGQILRNGGQDCFAAEGWTLPLPACKVTGERVPGKNVTMGIRPESLSLLYEGQHRSVLRMEVVLLEPLGAECVVIFQRGSCRLTSRMAGHLRLAPGEQVEVAFDMERVHWFDPHTGLALRKDGPAG